MWKRKTVYIIWLAIPTCPPRLGRISTLDIIPESFNKLDDSKIAGEVAEILTTSKFSASSNNVSCGVEGEGVGELMYVWIVVNSAVRFRCFHEVPKYLYNSRIVPSRALKNTCSLEYKHQHNKSPKKKMKKALNQLNLNKWIHFVWIVRVSSLVFLF